METLSTLAARFGGPASLSDFETHRLGDAVSDASFAKLVLAYLAGLGLSPTTLSDLLRSIDELEDEEDLSAIRCAEGVAVTSASDGWWVLFTEPGRG